MRIRDALIGASVMLTLGIAVPADSFEIGDPNAENAPSDALRFGMDLYRNGDAAAAAEALGFAADRGLLSAQWKLGEMYAHGDGVERDEYKAFQLFSQLVDDHVDESLFEQSSAYVASALVQLGTYYRQGIPDSVVTRDPRRAREYFTYAASYFRNPTAQFNLAVMYYAGEGGGRDLIQAAKWARLSADNGYQDAVVLLTDVSIELTRDYMERAPTIHNRRQALQWARVAADNDSIDGQALLGNILFEGDGIARRPVDGLMYLTIAMMRAPTVTWIVDMHEEAMSTASEDERNLARLRAEQWVADHPAQISVVATQ